MTITDYQVLQRSDAEKVDIQIDEPTELSGQGRLQVTLSSKLVFDTDAIAADGVWRAGLVLKTGGPYTITAEVQNQEIFQAQNIYVGDLWILAGQSNMEGYGALDNVEAPDPGVHSFDMADFWKLAEEPLHWLCDSIDPVHSIPYGNGDKDAIAEIRKTRTKGAGLGLTFAKELKAATGLPMGLIPCAQGGTVIPQWDPKDWDKGGESLYGAMIRRVKAVGGKVAGMLWYQGESDAMGRETHLYEARFRELVECLRADTGNPTLPVHTVQLGRFILPSDWDVAGPEEWNPMQDLQRRLPDEIPNVFVVPAIDLELEDGIHIATSGLRKLGSRLSRSVAKGRAGSPRLSSVTFHGPSKHILRISFAGFAEPGFDQSERVTGFSVQNQEGKETLFIFRAKVDPQRPSDVLLELIADLPDGWALWYGRGLDPTCSLRDAAGMPAPVFGPITPTQSINQGT